MPSELEIARASYVYAFCRDRDREEIETVMGYEIGRALLPDWLRQAVVLQTFGNDKHPIAFVAVHKITPRCVVMSLIATDEWKSVAHSVAKWGIRECMPFLLSLGYRRAECRAVVGHDDALAFLRWLGFRKECTVPQYGANGESFHQMAWVQTEVR